LIELLVPEYEEVYVGMDEPVITGASLGIGRWGASKGPVEPELELAFFELW
jgi:hypothetical protein